MSSSDAGSSPVVDDDVSDTLPRREFTAEERAAQAAEQRAEEAAYAREVQELMDEQKRVSAQIQSRRVQFGAAPAQADGSPAMQTEDDDVTYGFHDRKLVRVLFLENAADAVAPMAAAFVRHYESRVLSASIACVHGGPAAADFQPLEPLVVSAMESAGVALGQPIRHALSSLLSRTDARFQYIVSVDEASQSALAALPPSDLVKLGSPRLIHQAFQRPTDATEAEATRKAVLEFVRELPELLSFYA